VLVSSKRQGDTLQLSFPFVTAAPAAIFGHANALSLVFDSTSPIDVSRLKEDSGGVLREVSLRHEDDAQVVTLRLQRPLLASAAQDGTRWTVSLGESVVQPTAALTLTRELNPASQNVAVIPFEEPHRMHRLKISNGEEVLVVTGFAPARGFLRAQEFVEFRALPSTHGIVLQTLADDISVQLMADRLVVSRPGGLNITTAASAGVGNVSFASARPGAIDAQAWKQDRAHAFHERQTSLINAAAEATESKRTTARLDLARFYLAQEQFAEAKGVLDFALANERDQDQVAQGLVLRGVAYLMLQRHEEALKDFASPAIGNQYDAPLWRSISLSRQGRWAEARPGFREIETASSGLPVELQRVALAEAFRCSIELGDFGEATRRLNDFEATGASADFKPMLAVFQGRLAEGIGRAGDALSHYRVAAESTVAPLAVQGRLRRILLRFALRDVQRADVIAELEAITAAWRGDATELEALQLLARLYTEEKRYRPAFEIMRIAIAAFGKSEVARKIQEEASATFETIFLGDAGAALPPVEALGLFYDYHTLTPPGRRGDEMIRRLTDRLIAMDLLGQASELLQHQIDHRLQGIARAQIATRLATLYLSDRKPDRTLQVLRATRAGELPGELRAQRLLLEARALSDTGRHDVALEIAREITLAEAKRLRGDILWAARRWRDSAEQIEVVLDERWRDLRPLSVADRSDILRAAVGYALAEDVLGLDRFRQKYAAKMTETPDARMFDVVTTPVGARADEFVEAAKAASAVDTLTAFLRDLRSRFPDATQPAAQESARS
jgi:tetratricopeptide (TPR) repeat protein